MRSFIVLGSIALLAGCAATSGPAELPVTGDMMMFCSSPRGPVSDKPIVPGDVVGEMTVSASKDGSMTFSYRDPMKVGNEVKKVVVPAGYDCKMTAHPSAGTK